MIAIQYQQDTYYDETEIQHCWYAIDNGTRIGELYVAIDTEIISNIEVSEETSPPTACAKARPSGVQPPAGACFRWSSIWSAASYRLRAMPLPRW